MKVVLDCANGASYKVAPMVFKELGANVIDINTTPNGKNINDKCGSTHPEMLQKAVVENKADLGLAYDGDADRLIAVDENGNNCRWRSYNDIKRSIFKEEKSISK